MALTYRRHICCSVLFFVSILVVVTPAVVPNQLLKDYSDHSIREAVEVVTKLNKIFSNIPAENYKTRNAVVRDASSDSPFLTHLFDIFNIKKYYEKYQEKVSSTSMCLACKAGMYLLDYYMKVGATEDDIGTIARHVCTIFHIETPRVCDGVAKLFKKEIFVVLSQVALTPSEVCGLAIGKSCATNVNPFHNWTIPLTPFPKPPVRPILPPKPGSPVVRVLHLSDTHLDPYYKEGSLADCKEPLCCRESDGKPPRPGDGAGYWGDYRNCDTPLRTLESMLDHINKTEKFDYVIWTGDIPPHDIWNNSRNEVSFLLHKTSKLMKKYLGSVPIFPALGNHESSPVNSFPVPQVKGNDSIAWLYNELAKAWTSLFHLKATDTVQLGGYYSVALSPGFRIISVNMNYCNNLNWWLLLNSTDPTGELTWLVNQLQMAEIKGERVHILGHIPPGNFDCLSVWSHNYYEIIKRYESTVVAQFFGHTHNDEYEIFYDTDEYTPSSRAFSIAYIGPSITMYGALNPGYRIYTVDGEYKNSTRAVLDHFSYYMNLTEANASKQAKWQHEYSAKKAYNMTSLLPADWDKLTKKFEHDDNLFQTFYRYFKKMSDYDVKPCDAKCKKTLLCRLRRGCSDKGLCWS